MAVLNHPESKPYVFRSGSIYCYRNGNQQCRQLKYMYSDGNCHRFCKCNITGQNIKPNGLFHSSSNINCLSGTVYGRIER